MEVAGLAIGVVGVAGLFNNAIDCFRMVRLSRNFGSSYQTNLLKLDHAQLRLSRWGESVGLNGAGINDQPSTLVFSKLTEDQIKLAEKHLGQILVLFDESAKVSAKISAKLSSDDASRGENKLDITGDWLHRQMRELSRKRQNSASMKDKFEWVVWTESELRQLIEDIKTLTDNLIGLCPAAAEGQAQLAEQEVNIFSETLRTLNEAIKGYDQHLTSALDAILQRTDETYTYNTQNSSVGAQGRIMGSHNFNFNHR